MNILKTKTIQIGNLNIGNTPVVIAGPCSVESKDSIISIAKAVKSSGAHILRGGAFKPRTNPRSFQGLGLVALEYLAQAKAETGLPIVTECMDIANLEAVAQVADIIQIGARNMYNYPLLKAVGKTHIPILLKRAFSASLEEWTGAAEYIGHDQIIFCERGIRSFDPTTRNVLDLGVIRLLQEKTGLPVVVDPSHGTGNRTLVESMSRAAIAAGANGIMIEAHLDPDHSISDAKQTIDIPTLQKIIHFTQTFYSNYM